MITIIYNGLNVGQLTFRINPADQFSTTLDRVGLDTAHIGRVGSFGEALNRIYEYIQQEMPINHWGAILQQIEMLRDRDETYFEISFVQEPRLIAHR